MIVFKESQNNLSVFRPFYPEQGHCEGFLSLNKVWVYKNLFGMGNWSLYYYIYRLLQHRKLCLAAT